MPQTKSKKAPAPVSAPAKNSKVQPSAVKKSAPSKSDNGKGGEMLQKFLLDSIKDIYWAEKHLTKAIPKLSKAATSDELRSALQDHLEVTVGHVERLEKVFELLGKKAQAKKCEAMEGISKEADSIVEETEKGTSTRDVGIIMAAQKVEHYEIATYGGLVQLTKTMGLTEISDILAQTLAEEKEADETLTDIAENDINLKADEEGEDRSKA
ncbi:MAG: ferritin-like domain-containing protein [Flavitalea sp.]